MRRSRRALESRIKEPQRDADRAIAHYDLALFHDNNSREAEAIPHYQEALRLGLAEPAHSQALAWLASSLYKIGSAEAALGRIAEARKNAQPQLLEFLLGLEKRIERTRDVPLGSRVR